MSQTRPARWRPGFGPLGLVAALCLTLVSAPSARAGTADRKLYQQAGQALEGLRRSSARQKKLAEWENVVLAYRRVVARYPRSPYCDNALLAVGNLYREMAQRFDLPRLNQDAIKNYRMVVSEYPSSSLCERALFAAFELSRLGAGKADIEVLGRQYLKAYPRGEHAAAVKQMMRAGPVTASAPGGTPVQVKNLRFWTGDSSTRVVLDMDRQVTLRHDRIGNPDRLWIDLLGTRLDPELKDRTFPVGDGLLERVRIGPNREGVVRMVLDFKSVSDYNIFYLRDPARLVVDVTGDGVAEPPKPETASAQATEPAEPPGPAAREVASTAAADEPGPAPAPAPPQPPAANRKGDRSLARQLGLGARRIVIDPGHGGHDPGAIGPGGLREKDLVLDVALRLAGLLRSQLGAEVILTRSTDRFIPLEERTAIANTQRADLFLSIHANSSRSHKARGVETYYLNFATDPHAEEVAARENAISEATLKDLQDLVKAITLNSKIDESRDFAATLHEDLVPAVRPAPDRGVRTAPFYVLIGANMPSVLCEIAFVSHPDEERRLRSKDQRQKIAESLARGVGDYLEQLNPTQKRRLTARAQASTVEPGGSGRR